MTRNPGHTPRRRSQTNLRCRRRRESRITPETIDVSNWSPPKLPVSSLIFSRQHAKLASRLCKSITLGAGIVPPFSLRGRNSNSVTSGRQLQPRTGNLGQLTRTPDVQPDRLEVRTIPPFYFNALLLSVIPLIPITTLPVRGHAAKLLKMERETGFEPATSSLGS